jgi:zinc/manganese transport system permease protein
LYTGYATEAISLLFGEILGIAALDVLRTLAFTILILVGIGAIYRPLLFSSLDEEVAEAKGLPTLFIGVVFLLIVAVAVSIAVQVTGVLLIFSLMVTPAAAAQHLASRPNRVVAISVVISLAVTWIGLFVSFYEPYPASFFITAMVFALYVMVRAFHHRVKAPGEHRTGWKEGAEKFIRNDYPSP